ncbi:MAG: hypothetical protein IKI75_09945 [Lachnospiraceae bacterium]|nr:hypothetical protein [Lachnospiraceae bacterium]
MILESSKLRLEDVGTLYHSVVGDCLICRDLNMEGATLYTVLKVSSHDTVRKLIAVFEKSEAAESCLVDSFASDGMHIFVFPYRKSRELEQFYMGDAMPLERCEDICINVILACMTSALPWPFLYLVLQQKKLNLNKDDSIFLSYDVDLKELDPSVKEKDCVVACARVLLKLLESKATLKADSYVLLRKKIENQSYAKFTELYRDVRIAAVSKGRRGLFYRLGRFLGARKDRLLGIVFWISLVLVIVAIAMLFSNLLLGDIPWLRLFVNNFKQIGTESLLQ